MAAAAPDLVARPAPAGSDDAIRLEGLVKHFGRVRAVDGVDLVVPKGSLFALIGPNGAGKTTTFGLVCGWLRPTGGQATVLGASPWRAVHLKGRLAALPQDAALPPNTRVLDSLAFYGRLQGLNAGRARTEAAAALDRVGLAEWGKARASSLSHGMAKRVGLAQALMGTPELILLDEPTAGLDPKSAHWVRELLRGFQGKATVVISSHNLQELEALCDHAAILDHGQVIAAGSMAELTAADSEVVITLGNAEAEIEGLAAAAAALAGVSGATGDPARRTVTVRFGRGPEPAEEVITRVLTKLIASGGKIGSVSRGQGLERRVLAVT
jgi:ABC-2 type transport system ATP-binding protein